MSDLAANLLASANATGIAKATSVSLTGTANPVTAAQATTLSNLAHFALTSGATLTISDSAANFLAAGNAAGVAKATAEVLTGANTITAAQAATLAGLHAFSLASGATLVVSDNASNILAPSNAAGLTVATRLLLTGTSTVTAAQAASLAALTGFVVSTRATLVVSDIATNLLATGNARGLTIATGVLLIGSNTVTAALAAVLAAMTGFAVASGAALVGVRQRGEHACARQRCRARRSQQRVAHRNQQYRDGGAGNHIGRPARLHARLGRRPHCLGQRQ